MVGKSAVEGQIYAKYRICIIQGGHFLRSHTANSFIIGDTKKFNWKRCTDFWVQFIAIFVIQLNSTKFYLQLHKSAAEKGTI